jgi:hypothetical protein
LAWLWLAVDRDDQAYDLVAAQRERELQARWEALGNAESGAAWQRLLIEDCAGTDDYFEVIEHLQHDEANATEVAPEIRVELDRRVAASDRERLAGEPWEQVRAELFADLDD